MVYSLWRLRSRLLKRVYGAEIKELCQGLQGLLRLAEQRGISEILRCERLAIMAAHPGLKPLQLGLVEQHTGHECRHFLRRQRETQPQTCWATPPSHALVEILKDHPGDKTIV